MPWSSRATAIKPDTRLDEPDYHESQDAYGRTETHPSLACVARRATQRELQTRSSPDQVLSRYPPTDTAGFALFDRARARWYSPFSIPKTPPSRCQPALAQAPH